MKNAIQRGDVLNVLSTPSGGYTSGKAYVVGEFVGVAEITSVQTAPGVLCLKGVYELPKITGAITQGQIVYWDPAGSAVDGSTGAITTTAGSLKRAGTAWLAQASGDATVQVKLMW